MGKLKIELNDTQNIRDLLQNAYNLADEQIVQAQNEINKLSVATQLQEEPMDARSKYAKAINDYLGLKDKAISKKIEIAKILTKFDTILGIKINEKNSQKQDIPTEILDLIEKRKNARKNKDWDKSDELRDLINQKGYDIKDTKQGTEIKKR